MGLEWGSWIETGVSSIDDEHRKLFGAFNELIESLNSGKSCSYIDNLKDNFISVYFQHINHEEMLMEALNYPGIEEHIAHHVGFLIKLRELEFSKLAHNVYAERVIKIIIKFIAVHYELFDKPLAKVLQERHEAAAECDSHIHNEIIDPFIAIWRSFAFNCSAEPETVEEGMIGSVAPENDVRVVTKYEHGSSPISPSQYRNYRSG